MTLTGSQLRPARPAVAAAFVLLTAVTAAAFVPTFAGHVASKDVANVDTTVTDLELATDGSSLAVTFELTNPTDRAIDVTSADLQARAGGERLTRIPGTTVESVTLPARGSRTVVATLEVQDGAADTVRAAIESGDLTVSGQFQAEIGTESVDIDVEGEREASA